MTQEELDLLCEALEAPPGFDPWATAYVPPTGEETTTNECE